MKVNQRKTEYRAVVCGKPSLFEHSCRAMAGFIRDSGLDPEKGTTLIIGEDIPEDAEGFLPTKKAVLLKADCITGEEVMAPAVSLCKESLILFAPDPFCEELAVRLSVRLKGTSMTDVISLSLEETAAHVKRKIYGGHITGTFRLNKGPFFISISKGLDEAEPVSGKVKEIIDGDAAGQKDCCDRKITPVPAGSALDDAKAVVVGGRGLAGREGAFALSEMAEQMGAALGGTRPVIMNAWMGREKLVGVSGAMIHPDICIVCGGSGSPAFYEGIRRSKIIVAVNTDEWAPIMKKADACVCADWKEIMKELAKIVCEEQD